ncbi:hypothetical protein [Mycoplana sp. MJR14]|jgi:hypothetical protein|uniref:hypothetical protein n=1 Tax=Mycoplana sp. MJR14 TaxID=3032583 RepID=UPI0023DAE666|nr:hypothetical protein [Mycoplana sp. MJR14]MDF1632082.1 hypothetical protein [Mycoplana sp. MJR14]
MRGYLPDILGAAAGVAVALMLARAFAIDGNAQLALFALLPALLGAAAERIVAGRR